MHSRTIDVVTDWETVATPAGYEGLRQLVDQGFSGAVSAGPAWAFLLNGRIVGVFEGQIEDFEDADATAYRAADPSLPLLFAMQERGGETRANYYTNETPLRDVDQTLSNGGFTGYVELSENVLSGDYYVVYHGGKSMSVAFVGSSERLVTGEEAFETAADEVGIYEVVDVDVELVDIPGPEPEAESESESDPGPTADERTDDGDADAGGAGTGAGAATADDGAAAAEAPSVAGHEGQSADERVSDASAPASGTESESGAATGVAPETGTESESESEAGVGTEPDAGEAGPGAEPPAGDSTADPAAGGRETAAEPDPDPDPDPDPEVAPEVDPGPERGGAPEAEPGTGVEPESGGDVAADPDGSEGAPGGGVAADADAGATGPAVEDGMAQPGPDEDPTGADGTADAGAAPAGTEPRGGAGGEADGALTDEQRWQQARTIPSLDPEASAGGPDGAAVDEREPDAGRERTAQMQRQRRRRQAARDRTGPDPPRESAASSASAPGDGGGEVDRLRERLAAAKERIESLEAERDALRAEHEELVEERDALRSERAERVERVEALEAERDRLREEVDRLRERLDGDDEEDASGESMSSDRALSGTNLFVRYDSKGQATLKHAHAGEASRSDVRENLRLEHHTTFEAEGVTVGDRPYEEFLRDSTEYAFARWVVSDLLYEIGGTGNRSELAGVFDAIPDIDRVELHGTVGVETTDGVEERSFDVVFRDRMGDPLFVADINPSRDATTEAMVGSLVENTHTVATEAETLAAGLYVTESFYEPGALETVADRTGGGLLSRSKKRSFVKLSRKRGYHLCLVEARDGEFHLNVPEL